MVLNILKSKVKMIIKHIVNASEISEQQLLVLGRSLSEAIQSKKKISSLAEVEFKVFSQWGDDGIIQWLVSNLNFTNKSFIEFGVENYKESSTRFLMMNNNWSGLVMDGSAPNINHIKDSEYFWRHHLIAKASFIDADNINDLIYSSNLGPDVGIMHIDLDGNDYWIWKAINVVSPVVVIVEYNSVFGLERAITVPYDKDFTRYKAHYSGLYCGASLRALHKIASVKGYAFIGCNSAGNNAYFVRKDQLNDNVREVPLETGYVLSKFRESRDQNGRLTYLAGQDRLDVIRGMPVYNVETNEIEKL
jgi:hypothetical protein